MPGTPFTKKNAAAMGSKGGKKSKRKPLLEQWQAALEKKVGNSGKSTLDLLYGLLLNEAKKGSIMAIKEILDRAHGKPKQTIEHEGELDTNINIKVKYD